MVGPVAQVVGLPRQVTPFHVVPAGQDMVQGTFTVKVPTAGVLEPHALSEIN